MPPRQPAGSGDAGLRRGRYTRAEVATHNTVRDMWIIIDDKVYDVTAWLPEHPGGIEVIKCQAGRDATEQFYAFHADDTSETLGNYFIGDLAVEERIGNRKDADARKDRIIQDYRKLTEEMKRKGLFESSKLYYYWKISTHLMMAATFLWLLVPYTSMTSVVLSGLLCGVFYAQSGWLSHDFLHHQVWKNRSIGNWVAMFTGGIWQGFSQAWWKNKHNTHHAACNELDNDPDIDSIPFLSFHPVLLRDGQVLKTAPASKWLLPIQVFTFIPIICLARLNWCVTSITYVLSKDAVVPMGKTTELVFLAIHWALKFSLMFVLPQSVFWTWFAISEATGGFLIGIFFILNHNGMAVFRKEEFEKMEFVTLQVLTSRDVISNIFTDFMTGGLNYQIEHHLWPKLPRHNFHKVAPLLDELCAKHGIPIHRTHLVDGLKEFWKSLAVSQDCIKNNNFKVPHYTAPHYSN